MRRPLRSSAPTTTAGSTSTAPLTTRRRAAGDQRPTAAGRVRRWRAAGMALAIALTVVGCAANLPKARPDAVPAVPPPVLSVTQSTSVLDKIGAVLADGDTNLSDAGLPARLSGPALAIRSAEYRIALGTAGERQPTLLPMKAQALITSQTDTWPRYELVVTEQPDDLQSPRLLVLRQADARSAYTLWAWTRLLAAVKMPATADPKEGSALLAPDAPGLLLTPSDTLAQYVDVLTNGDASPHAPSFQADEYRAGLASSLALLKQSLAQVGTVEDTYAAAPDQLVALRTATGGALVIGGITTTTTAKVTVAGATFNLRPTEASLAGVSVVSQSETITWADLVAFYVPPAGAGTTVQVLAAEHQRIAVTAQ